MRSEKKREADRLRYANETPEQREARLARQREWQAARRRKLGILPRGQKRDDEPESEPKPKFNRRAVRQISKFAREDTRRKIPGTLKSAISRASLPTRITIPEGPSNAQCFGEIRREKILSEQGDGGRIYGAQLRVRAGNLDTDPNHTFALMEKWKDRKARQERELMESIVAVADYYDNIRSKKKRKGIQR